HGTFEFHAGETHAAGGGCAFEAGPLVDGAYAKVASWWDVTAALGSVDRVPAVSRFLPSGAPSVTLDPEEWYVLSAVDGRRSVRAMARELGETLYAVAHTVRALVDRGLVHLGADAGLDVTDPAELVAVLAMPPDL